MPDVPVLSRLFVYPVKSLRGVAVDRAVVEPRGLRHDRRWMVVGADGQFLTQRTCPDLARLDAAVTADGLRLHADTSTCTVLTPSDTVGSERAVVWNDTVAVRPADAAAHAWLSAFLDRSARLVYLPPASVRRVDPAYRRRPDDQVSLADGYPALLTAEGSLDDLNRRIDAPLPMDRFRPNLVVRGTAPFAEDTWRRIRIGGVTFDVVKPCGRCVVTTRDQRTGAAGKEPLRTLATFRRGDDGTVYFGQNLIPASMGTIAVGDAVEVLETGPAPVFSSDSE